MALLPVPVYDGEQDPGGLTLFSLFSSLLVSALLSFLLLSSHRFSSLLVSSRLSSYLLVYSFLFSSPLVSSRPFYFLLLLLLVSSCLFWYLLVSSRLFSSRLVASLLVLFFLFLYSSRIGCLTESLRSASASVYQPKSVPTFTNHESGFDAPRP